MILESEGLGREAVCAGVHHGQLEAAQTGGTDLEFYPNNFHKLTILTHTKKEKIAVIKVNIWKKTMIFIKHFREFFCQL